MNLAVQEPKVESADFDSAYRGQFHAEAFGLSDRGQIRCQNEDCFSVALLAKALQIHRSNLPQPNAISSHPWGYLFLVADGVGENKAGKIASELSVTTIEEFLLNRLQQYSNLQASEEQDVLRELQNALFQADARLFKAIAAHPEWRGMATTLTMAFAVNGRLFVAHAGDSRCYVYSGNKLQQITQDHTITGKMVRYGVLPPEDEAHHPWRHVVTNIVGGTVPGVQVELHSLDLHSGDVLLLCSDGLTEMVPEDQIADILEKENDVQRACERLVGEANQQGDKDYITLIVAHIGEI